MLADDGLLAALRLAGRLLKMLVLLDDGDGAGLLDLAVEPPQEVLSRFFAVFAGHLYHRLAIVLQQRLNLQLFSWISAFAG